MNGERLTDARLAIGLRGIAPTTPPDLRARILADVETTHQERGVPAPLRRLFDADTVARRRVLLSAAALVAMLVLLGAIALLAGGLRRDTRLGLVENGWIVYANGGPQPGTTDGRSGTDLSVVRVGGQPIMIASRGDGSVRNVCPRFSPDGRYLAYGTRGPAGSSVVVLGIDAGGPTASGPKFRSPRLPSRRA